MKRSGPKVKGGGLGFSGGKKAQTSDVAAAPAVPLSETASKYAGGNV